MQKYIVVYGIQPNRYLIDEYGNILDTVTDQTPPIHEYRGYLTAVLRLENGKLQSFRIHRLVAATFTLCRLVNHNVVNHLDMNTHNNYIGNLQYTDNIGNSRHAIHNQCRKLVEDEIEPIYLGNTNKAGINNGRAAVMDPETINKICQMMEDKVPYTEILEQLGLPNDKRYLDIITKIRSKKLWYCISKNYNIPNKEYRSPATIYTEDEIRTICDLIAKGASNADIANVIGVDQNDYKKMDCFRHFIQRIRNKKTFIKISDDYF